MLLNGMSEKEDELVPNGLVLHAGLVLHEKD